MTILVIIPCGRKKIWYKHPHAGPTPAKDAYIGGFFANYRKFAEYCERKGATWVILSAGYGFLTPDCLIENYDETFDPPSHNAISDEKLKTQVSDKGLTNFDRIVVACSSAYAERVRRAFEGQEWKLEFPLEGHNIKKRLKELMESGYPFED